MRIERFGDTYSTAYTFDTYLMRDRWESSRPPIIQRVSGAGGAFDYYGSNNFPIAPFDARKRFAISASSEADIEDELDALRNNTIAAGRSNLWWLDRDGSTTYWTYAKCTELNTSDTYREKGKWLKNVDIEFECPEGVWYSSSAYSVCSWSVTPASEELTLSPSGNIATGIRFSFIPDDGTMTAITANANSVGWTFSGAVAQGDVLIVDSDLYVVTNNAADAYSDLAVTASNTLWLALAQDSGGELTIDLSGITGTATTITASAFYWDTYVL